MSPHRLRRGALHLPTRRSRQNANLFLREPLATRAGGTMELELLACEDGDKLTRIPRGTF